MNKCAAFLYQDYYCYGIKRSFAGLYDDDEDALSCIRGTRDVKINLELFDLESCEFQRYRWIPLYEDHGKYEEGPSLKRICWLTHRWDETKPQIDLEWDGDVRRWGHNNVFYDAGEWKWNEE
jgi:hypothetical protein